LNFHFASQNKNNKTQLSFEFSFCFAKQKHLKTEKYSNKNKKIHSDENNYEEDFY